MVVVATGSGVYVINSDRYRTLDDWTVRKISLEVRRSPDTNGLWPPNGDQK